MLEADCSTDFLHLKVVDGVGAGLGFLRLIRF
jgi:hypothetical protein